MAPIAPGTRRRPVEREGSEVSARTGRDAGGLLCSRGIIFPNNRVSEFTLEPGRPIPVSPWIPGGPESPLSPYKKRQAGTDMCKHTESWEQGITLT